MKLSTRRMLAIGTPLLFAACATVGPPQPPSLELPKPPSDLRAVRKGNRVTLSWTIPTVTTDRQRVQRVGPTRICRGLEPELTKCGTPVGESPAQPSSVATKSATTHLAGKKPFNPKIEDRYTDSLTREIESDDPFSYITYAVEVFNLDGRGAGLSNQVHVSLVRTAMPPQDLHAQVTSQGILLTWTNSFPEPHATPNLRYVYRVYRRIEGSQQSTLVGELPTEQKPIALADSNIEWEKTYDYRAETVTEISQEGKPAVEVEGDDSPEVKVFAHDIFPPAVPSGLQAVFSGPGQQPFIDLIWAPVTDLDLAGYNIYRHEEGGPATKLNAEVEKTPAYRDIAAVPGKKYFYSVSSIDVRGNESARSGETSETIP